MEKTRRFLLGIKRKEEKLNAKFEEMRSFMKSWMDLLARNLADLEKDLVALTRKFVRLELKASERET